MFVGPTVRIGLATSSPMRNASTRLPSLVGSGSPSIDIAPQQLIPNSWRIVVNCMKIWLAANGDMIKVGELVYLYHLKESKEYGYYELVPWARRARIIIGLPSSFRYWKSRFFFVSGDDFETLTSEAWGNIPRLLCRWGTPNLGVSIFLIIC